MNLYDSILASQPLTAFKLNTAGTGYTDITNRGVVFTPDPSLAFNAAIISGDVSKSMDAKNATRAWFTTGQVYRQGNERLSWSLEAWAVPRNTSDGLVRILSHPGAFDGIYIDTDFIHFTVHFATLPDIDLKWAMPDALEGWHIVGTYTQGKMQLYVNGELVDSADVTEEYVSDGFGYSNTSFFVGYSTGSMAATVDGIATYTRALADAEIYRHFMAGRRVMPFEEIAGLFGGTSFDGSSRDVFISKTWSTKSDWEESTYTDVEFENDSLSPIEDIVTLESLPGVWTGFALLTDSPTNIYGVTADWDSTGALTVEASINNGTTWATLVNGRTIPGTFNWLPTTPMLIRVTFAGGVVSDVSEVDRLRVVAYSSPYVNGTHATRKIEITHQNVSTMPESNEPIERNYRAGFETYTSGTYQINPDTDVEDPRPVRTLEVWWKPNESPTSKYVFDARPGGATEYLWVSGSNVFSYINGSLYVNGVSTPSGTFTPLQDTWYHLVYVFSADISTVINFPSNGLKQVGLINVYPTALSAADAALIYKLYTGYPDAVLATDNNPVSETSGAYKLYAYDWSISPAG